jgi:hypothetical protein
MKVREEQNSFFWNIGNGNDFLNWAKLYQEQLTPIHSDHLFREHDEQVDELVKNWLQDRSFGTIMKYLNNKNTSAKLPEDFINLQSKHREVPDWVNFESIKCGAELSQRSGLVGLLVLRNFALMGGYIFTNLTKPLVATGSLEKGARHRLYNTLNFWTVVSRSGEMSQEQRINACLTTRLVHSASRLMIEKNNPDWDYENLGVPINMADIIATNIAFTVYYLYGLEKLNFSYTQEEEDGIFHLWQYVTWLLGVPKTYIPTNRSEALSFFYFWTSKQNAPDSDSVKLAESLMEENTTISLLKFDFLRRNTEYIHKSISNYLLDQQTLNALKIQPVRFKYIIPNMLKLKNKRIINRNQQVLDGNNEQVSVLKDYTDAFRIQE